MDKRDAVVFGGVFLLTVLAVEVIPELYKPSPELYKPSKLTPEPNPTLSLSISGKQIDPATGKEASLQLRIQTELGIPINNNEITDQKQAQALAELLVKSLVAHNQASKTLLETKDSSKVYNFQANFEKTVVSGQTHYALKNVVLEGKNPETGKVEQSWVLNDSGDVKFGAAQQRRKKPLNPPPNLDTIAEKAQTFQMVAAQAQRART
jgi:hypothetical protein